MWNDLAVFTLTTDLDHPGVKRLAASAMKFDIPLTVCSIPAGRPYKEIIRTKHLAIREKLEELRHFERFLFLDAWDTAFVGALPEWVFTAARLSFGAELNCYPGKKEETRYTTQAEPFPYLNSGVIWGPTAEYLRLCPKAPGHDQGRWTGVYFAYPGELLLDHRAEVVLNLHSTKAEDLSYFRSSVRYNPTGSSPAILHGNGKWPLPEFIK
jgi:hypothetical protein